MSKLNATVLVLGLACNATAQLSGNLSGTLGPGIYHVTDHIAVQQSDSVTLVAGTSLIFDGAFEFTIIGVLAANGTYEDSIAFVNQGEDSVRWGGIRLLNATEGSSHLSYCRIEWAQTSGNGGGLYCGDNSPTLQHCSFTRNQSNNGGAVYIFSGSPTFKSCVFDRNRATVGAGVTVNSHASPRFEQCVFHNNTADLHGGAVYCVYGSPLFTNCTFSDNRTVQDLGHGKTVCSIEASPDFVNCIIAHSTRPMWLENSPGVTISYCNFFDFGTQWNIGPDTLQSGMGVVDHTNWEGDSCDKYFNLFIDPEHADHDAFDFTLLGTSPCINAGNPCMLDPDSTVSDIGAFFVPQELPEYADTVKVFLCTNLVEQARYLSWRPFRNAVSYRILRSQLSELPYDQWLVLATVPGNIREFVDAEPFESDSRYYYRIEVTIE